MHLMVYTDARPTGISKVDDVKRCHALKGRRLGTLLRHAWARLGQSVHSFVMRVSQLLVHTHVRHLAYGRAADAKQTLVLLAIPLLDRPQSAMVVPEIPVSLCVILGIVVLAAARV